MAQHLADSNTISFFCDSIAVMLAAGIQTDEAVNLFIEDMEDTPFRDTCSEVYKGLISGKTLARSMEETQAFPRFAISMVSVGEQAGRIEDVLRNLSVYYNEEARLFEKIRSSIAYPAALFCVMSVILAFTVLVILPVFIDVYNNLSGSLTAGSFNVVGVSLVIGWAALIITLVMTIGALVVFAWSRSGEGRLKVLALLEKFPPTRQAMYQLALSRFMSALATYIAAGMNSDDAMRDALKTVEHPVLHEKVSKAYDLMTNLNEPLSLTQAMAQTNMLESAYIRMLTIGTRSGSLDSALGRISSSYFEESLTQLDKTIDGIEPALAAFLTIAVGATLIAVMLPLVGIMSSIG